MISLGIDFGTSGARAIVIDEEASILVAAKYTFTTSQLAATTDWQTALFYLIEQIPSQIRREIGRIAINGTSSTVLLCNWAGNPVKAPLLYNDACPVAVIDKLQAIAPPNHTVISATSSLAKLLLWQDHSQAEPGNENREPRNENNSQVPGNENSESGNENNKGNELKNYYFLHQADWLAFLLHGQLGVSDYHNALKLGYDVERLCYPDWLIALPFLPLLPKVLIPGTPVGEVTDQMRSRFGFQRNCLVCAGTTDSIAAFLASGARSPGEAVTSLGSTLVLKLLSHTRVEDSRYGIYSHRLGELWLTGGASNTGGAVLRQFFTDAQLESLSYKIDAQTESPLDYYPLVKPGDRFPINDPQLPARLEPRPENEVDFLHGLLESMARIESRGYHLLQRLGATKLNCVYTAGGGAKNQVWTKIRARHLQVPLVKPVQAEAAYGTALLALRGLGS